jgi:hypothetical protein
MFGETLLGSVCSLAHIHRRPTPDTNTATLLAELPAELDYVDVVLDLPPS